MRRIPPALNAAAGLFFWGLIGAAAWALLFLILIVAFG